jgi:phosphomethylpyrimidine synthase
MTQIDAARAGRVTEQMKIVAEKEHLDPEVVRERVARGSIAIPANVRHTALSPEGVGEGLRTKINVNLGVSGDRADEPEEWKKVDLAISYGAEAIMDLSNCGKTHPFRSKLVAKSPAMIGTVPMYDALGYLEKPLETITADDFLRVVRAHAEDGVDFVTIHAGINRRTVDSFLETGRKMNIVSRGGSLIFAWMQMTGNENPFFEHYDELLEILHEYDVTISIGDAMRPGCIADSTDAGQIDELIEIGKLTTRAWDVGVQVMVEGPGHMAMDEIAANMKLEKRLCHNAPFYVLGPLVTDVAPGYDHITSAIGGAIAAANGADFLCYVTPAEHLRLPDADDVREGIVAAKIAAHAADLANHLPGVRDADNKMADARRRMNWDDMFAVAIDPVKPRAVFESAPPSVEGTCTMCGEMCSVRTVNRVLDNLPEKFGGNKMSPRDAFAPRDLLLYAVSDDRWLGARTLSDCIEQAIAGGATFVQLRAKEASHDEIVAMAEKLKPLCAKAGVPFVIDDDVEAAKEADVDGVHVGQEDASCAAARAALGPDKIVGVSCQTVEEAIEAERAGADYLGVGAVVATPTKPESWALTPEEFRAICQAVSIPVVAIGGCNAETIPTLASSGAAGAAVVSAIFASDDCERAARDLRAVCERTFPAQERPANEGDELRERVR